MIRIVASVRNLDILPLCIVYSVKKEAAKSNDTATIQEKKKRLRTDA